MKTPITASMLYDYVQCPHRVSLDLFGNPEQRDPISAFVQLLWERGSAFEPKKHYAVQLGLYTDILDKLGLSAGHIPFVWDIHGEEVIYELDSQMGKRDKVSLWEFYESCLENVTLIVNRQEKTLPALCSMCRLCHWRSFCLAQLKEMDDLSLIPELGRSRRDVMLPHFKNVGDLANCDLNDFIKGEKTVIPGIGSGTLEKFQERAKLLNQPENGPYLKEKISLSHSETELFFDVETDPMRDVCYLHGFVERRNSDPKTEKYVAFFADQPIQEDEYKAFKEAWHYIRQCPPCLIYYYSPYERTTWRKLQKRYPDVMSETDLENMFSPDTAVDLYLDIVRSKTEWPTYDYSIKTLATFLKFKWRDKEPSGAASIEWYHRWVESGKLTIRQRILDYNEDDCIAMRVLLDAVAVLQIKNN